MTSMYSTPPGRLHLFENGGSSRRSKAVCTPSHDKTSPIFSIDQEPVRRLFTWFFVWSAMGQLRDADQALRPLIGAGPKLPSYRGV
ncbi:hypothetical protein TNCV_3797641 [Trichonephila clavipes]|nr:hypothetical protein TNCV_3797641 [Trichonephila clavipes]